MHPSALDLGKRFFSAYCPDNSPLTVLDIGAQNVNGSLKAVCPAGANYVGVDFVPGTGVDVILEDPYKLPFTDCSADIVVCSSVFEHSQFFWLLFLEILRVLKPNGLFYLNVPSNGYVHRYPVDCWRFYPDSGFALVEWGKRNGYSPALLESFIAAKQYQSIDSDAWNDFVAVFVKTETSHENFPARILENFQSFSNGFRYGSSEELNPRLHSDDFLIIKDRENSLSESQARLLESQALVRERDDQILSQKLVLAEQDDRIARLNETARECDEQLAQLNRALLERDAQVARLSEDMAAIKASRTWALIQRIAKIKKLIGYRQT